MSYSELRDTLAAIAEHCNVVGLDLVEVNPTLDVGTGITSYLAAHTVLEFLGNICLQPRWGAAARRAPRPAAEVGRPPVGIRSTRGSSSSSVRALSAPRARSGCGNEASKSCSSIAASRAKPARSATPGGSRLRSSPRSRCRGLLRKVPGMLRDPAHPLKTSVGFVLRNLPWFMRFARSGSPGEVARITDALHVLLSRGDAAIDRLTAGGRCHRRHSDRRCVLRLPEPGAGRGGTRRDGRERSARDSHAVVSGDRIRDIEPAIPSSVTCGFTNRRSGSFAVRSSSPGRSSAPSPRLVASSYATRSSDWRRGRDALRGCAAAGRAMRRTRW